VFLSSHILSEVEQLCERVGIIREGGLVQVGSVAELRGIKRYEITVTFADSVPAEAFTALPGVEQVEALDSGRTLRVAVAGSPDPVIKAAAQHPIVNLISSEPSLEDIFLRFYQGDGAAVKEAQHVVQ
jgi:ABC-2 type transport system ATP-binding protein